MHDQLEIKFESMLVYLTLKMQVTELTGLVLFFNRSFKALVSYGFDFLPNKVISICFFHVWRNVTFEICNSVSFIPYFCLLVFGTLVTLVAWFFFFFFLLDQFALQNVNKDYVIFSYFCNFVAQNDQKPKMKNGMNETSFKEIKIFHYDRIALGTSTRHVRPEIPVVKSLYGCCQPQDQ